MSYSQLKLDFIDLLSTKGGGTASTDITNHANSFADAVDNYVKELYDPAKRKVKSTNKQLMIPSIVAIANTPGTGTASIDANNSALKYATAIQLYTLAIVIDTESITSLLGGIVTPPGNIDEAKIVAPEILTSIQDDFNDIFTEDTPDNISIDSLIQLKAEKFADAIKNAFTTKTQITINGKDSTLPPPAGTGPKDFSIIGPLSEE